MVARSISKLKRSRLYLSPPYFINSSPLFHHPLRTLFLFRFIATSITIESNRNNPDHPNITPFSTSRTHAFYTFALQSCITHKVLTPGKQLHAHLCQVGLGSDTLFATKLVNVYCVCGSLRNARNLFEKIPKGNLFLWNIMIRGYAWDGPYEAALELYYRLLGFGLVPNNFTFPFVLKACSALSAIDEGKEIHEHVVRTGWQRDVFVGAALIDMYAKCGYVDNAREVFDKIAVRDVVLWNSMLAAYSQNGRPAESLSLCSEMVLAGLRLDEASFVIVVSASAAAAELLRGRELHGFAWRRGFAVRDKVKTALLDMYAKCGLVQVAWTLFKQLRENTLVSWNAMITGYAMQGYAKEALDIFEKMRKEMEPNQVTFTGVLSACSYGGLLDEGRRFFKMMTKEYRIEPIGQHYTCIVDLLGHAGRFSEAYDLMKQMNVTPNSTTWGALLNSCKIHGNVEFGELALEKLIELEPEYAGNYVILSNIYAQAGKWEKVAKLRTLMKERGVKKSIACSWINVKNTVHSFLSGDTSHPQSEKIYVELKRLEGKMQDAGYVPNTGSVFHNVEDEDKSNMLCSHSERLAIAFGLISTPPRTRLLITKNLKICDDCHVAIKIISKITEREITIRDVNRYHHFRGGICSCGDYW